MSVTAEYQVSGMSCGHCESSVRREIGQVAGVQLVDISAKTGKLTVSSTGDVDDAQIIAAVDEAGYEAVRV